MGSSDFWANPSTSPFVPHFGVSPPLLVGRRSELSALGSGLASGPRDARYCSILMGVRGSGKTALLNEVQREVAAAGWVVLAVDASTPGLLDRIVASVDRAEESYEALEVGDRLDATATRSVGIHLGVLAGKLTTTRRVREVHAQALRERLTTMAAAAQSHGTSMLLTVDELHAVDRTEGRRLAGDLQHIIKREELPLAFLGAGLSEMKNTLLTDPKVTFFHRCEPFDLPPLATEDAINGLRDPIAAAGGRITPGALQLAAQAVDGSPYKMQVIGDQAWRQAGAPEAQIDEAVAADACTIADTVYAERVSLPAWRDLSDAERSVLVATARHGGRAKPRDVAGQIGSSSNATADRMSHMANAGYLARASAGSYQITGLVPLSVVSQEGQYHELGAPTSSEAADGSAVPARCNRWMPRARARCALASGHAGRCRSR